MTARPATAQGDDSRAGFVFAISAYALWGFLPLYMKLAAHIGPAEVVAHRVVWSLPLAGGLLIALGRTADIRAALTSPRTLAMGCLTAALISINWGIYVWAITSDRALDAALGYYINPLFSVFLGAVFLGERLNRQQLVAIGLAFAAVVILTLEAGGLPWAAVGLTVSWGLYALCKRQLPIGPNQGFLLEVLILFVPALGYILILESGGTGHFIRAGARSDVLLLLGMGIVTAVPLILYVNGAKRLRLTTIAVLQYVAPTMIFLVAVFLFDEPFAGARLIAFPMIWAALILYTLSLLRRAERPRPASAPRR